MICKCGMYYPSLKLSRNRSKHEMEINFDKVSNNSEGMDFLDVPAKGSVCL